MLSNLWPYIAALIPFLGGALIFYVIMKNMLEGDRNERIAMRRWDEEHGRSPKTAQGVPGAGAPADDISED